MKIIETAIEDVVIIEPRLFKDERGYFFESFSQREFEEKIRKISFVQDNESKSSYGVLRGLHFQKPPYAQSKLVRVIKGAVLDVAVDIREKRGRAGHAAAAFERGALGSIVAVDERRDERGVHSDDALAKLRRYNAQRHIVPCEDHKVNVHIAQLVGYSHAVAELGGEKRWLDHEGLNAGIARTAQRISVRLRAYDRGKLKIRDLTEVHRIKNRL